MITNPEKYGLQPGIEKPGSDYEGFPVSVYHQLHCLVRGPFSLMYKDSVFLTKGPENDTHSLCSVGNWETHRR
jgi:hypothetical protein